GFGSNLATDRGSTGKICGENGVRGNDLDSVDRDEWNRLPYPNNQSRAKRLNGGGNRLISVTGKDVFGVTCGDKK
ncbi:hypothetical protein U1Q18_017559, partial [Sarracenia purpurea var. burkii]